MVEGVEKSSEEDLGKYESTSTSSKASFLPTSTRNREYGIINVCSVSLENSE